MNTDLLRWLLNVERIPADAETVRLIFERPLPAWLWALCVIGAGLFAIWSYSGLTGPRIGRGMLAALRFAAIMALLTLLSGPMLEMPRESVEQDWVLMLVDRSASMQIADVEADSRLSRHGGQAALGSRPNAAPESPTRITRDEQLRRALDEHAEVFAALDEQKVPIWLGFHVGAFTLERHEGTPVPAHGRAGSRGGEARRQGGLTADSPPPDGRRTNINTSIEQALQRAAARPLSGIVLFSDGRTSDPPKRALLRRLQQDAVPVFTVPLGSPEPLADLAIRRIDAPRRAFIRDKVPVTVQLDRLGEQAHQLGATIRLTDELTGEELAAEQLPAGRGGPPGDYRDEVTLTASPELAGSTTWRVTIDTDQPTLVPDRLVMSFPIELIDRPLRVLYVDGYPRWEYRFVKNLLIREQSIESSIMLLSADRDFAQEGNQPITRLPRSPGEFAEFDVIILGDLPGTFFSHDQVEMMRDLVAERGAGLLWIAGERYTPLTFAGSPLADLLPMRGSLELPTIARPLLMHPTPLAERLGILNLATPGETGWPRELTDPAYGWSQLRWAQRIDPAQLKPTAEVLAIGIPASEARLADGEPPSGINLAAESAVPLVTLMRYGAGRSIYVATDEIWRWRYGRGEVLPEQFWVQMIRMLGRESVTAADALATLDVSPRRVQSGQPMRVDVQLLDSRLAELGLERIGAVIETPDGTPVAEIDLSRLDSQDQSSSRYAATYITETAGPGVAGRKLRVRLTEPELDHLDLEAGIEVFMPDDELRQPETDHELLRHLAEATNGAVLMPDELATLPELLPNRAVTISNPLTERIWDTPFFFILVLTLLTLEWVGRKIVRLV